MKSYAYAALAAGVLLAGLTAFLAAIALSGPGDSASRLAGGEASRSDDDGLSGRGGTARGAPVAPAPSGPRRGPGASEEDAARSVEEPPDEPPPPPPIPRGGCFLAIAVEDSSGRPLGGVVVTLRSGMTSEERETDAGGEAIFDSIAPGVYSFLLESEGRPKLVSATSVELGDGDEKELAVALADYDLSVSGRVLNQEAEPVEGIELVALRQMLEAEEGTVVPASQSDQRARTDERGRFEIAGLDAGDYELRTLPTEIYPSETAIVRAGVDSAQIVLAASRELRVYGTVRGTNGETVSGVRVVPVGQAIRGGRTDDRGEYELFVVVATARRPPMLRFLRDGYRERQLPLRSEDLEGLEETQVDVVLERIEETVTVWGQVRTSDGAPVAGETVHLHSQLFRTRHEAVSDAQGAFSMEGVQVGADYRLWARPAGPYQDYSRKGVAVRGDGGTLEVVLKHLGRGRLTGRMVDQEGRPVPRFGLWLASARAVDRSVRVTGDAEGLFVVDGVPEGPLTFESRSFPRLVVSGYSLDPGALKEVTLIIDWGEHEIHGRVTDPGGQPVQAAQVYLSWYRRQGAARSRSTRRTTSNQDGRFQFTQLGPGIHRLNASAPGFRGVQVSCDVAEESEEIELRLEEVAR